MNRLIVFFLVSTGGKSGSISVQPRKPTVGSLDMGGASTQITFEVSQNVSLVFFERVGLVSHECICPLILSILDCLESESQV